MKRAAVEKRTMTVLFKQQKENLLIDIYKNICPTIDSFLAWNVMILFAEFEGFQNRNARGPSQVCWIGAKFKLKCHPTWRREAFKRLVNQIA
jgi:hypothetical protein